MVAVLENNLDKLFTEACGAACNQKDTWSHDDAGWTKEPDCGQGRSCRDEGYMASSAIDILTYLCGIDYVNIPLPASLDGGGHVRLARAYDDESGKSKLGPS